MPSDFNAIRKLYDDDRFVELLHHPNGVFWLKLRSISRAEQIRQFCQRIQFDTEGIQSRQLFEQVYNQKPDGQILENFILSFRVNQKGLRRIFELQIGVRR